MGVKLTLTLSDFLILLLVIIGLWYTYETRRMVMQTKKDRRVQILKERLEKLYSPMILNGAFWEMGMTEFKKLVTNHPSYHPDSEAKKFLDTFRDYAYLSSDELYPILSEFHQLYKKMDKSEREFEDFKKRFWTQLKKDFERYRDELLDLTTMRLNNSSLME